METHLEDNFSYSETGERNHLSPMFSQTLPGWLQPEKEPTWLGIIRIMCLNTQADNVRGLDLSAAQMGSWILRQSGDNPTCFLQSPTPRVRLRSISLIYFSENFFFILMGAENNNNKNPSVLDVHRLKMHIN